MVLIAIDKHSRKILGYLCKNNQNVAYCCSECDVEFSVSIDLENHMVKHEQCNSDQHLHVNESNINVSNIEETNTENSNITESYTEESNIEKENTEQQNIAVLNNDASEEKSFENKSCSSSEGDIPLQILSNIEKENLLMLKYQVIPCTVVLNRFDDYDDTEMEESDSAAESNGTNHDNITIEEAMINEESIDSEYTMQFNSVKLNVEPISMYAANSIISPSTSSVVSISNAEILPIRARGRPKKSINTDSKTAMTNTPVVSKRRKIATQKGLALKKSLQKTKKMKTTPASGVCVLCGDLFQTTLELNQHVKTHYTRAKSPVFPCTICHQNVKNLKMHLRQHKIDGRRDNSLIATRKTIKSNEITTDLLKLNDSNKSNEVSTLIEPDRMILPDDSMVTKEEASSSTDAIVPSNKEPEIITSNEAQTNSTDSNGSFIPNGDTMNVEPDEQQSFISPIIINEYPTQLQEISITEPISVNEPSQSFQTGMESDGQSDAEENDGHSDDIKQSDDGQFDDIEQNDDGDNGDDIEQNGVGNDGGDGGDGNDGDDDGNDGGDDHHDDDDNKKTGEKNCEKTFGVVFKCSTCPRRFNSVDRVREHQKKHEQKGNCEICGKQLALSYMRMHIKLKHPPEKNISFETQQAP